MKFTLMIVFGLVVLGAAFAATTPGCQVVTGSLNITISVTEMDIADINEGAGDGVVVDTGVGCGGRYGWGIGWGGYPWGWTWGWGYRR